MNTLPTKWTQAKQHSLCVLSCALLGACLEVVPDFYSCYFPEKDVMRMSRKVESLRKTLQVQHWSVKGRKHVQDCIFIANDYMPYSDWPQDRLLYHWLTIWLCIELLWTDATTVCGLWTIKSPVWGDAGQWLLTCNEPLYAEHDSEATRAYIMYDQMMTILKK